MSLFVCLERNTLEYSYCYDCVIQVCMVFNLLISLLFFFFLNEHVKHLNPREQIEQ